MPVSYDLTVIFSLTPQSDVAYCVGLLQNLLRKSIDLQAYGSFSCFILCRLDCSRQATFWLQLCVLHVNYSAYKAKEFINFDSTRHNRRWR